MIIIIIIIIIINEYYYSAVESKKLQQHSTTEKMKPTTVSRGIRTEVRLSEIKRAAEEQCLEQSCEGDQSYDRFHNRLRRVYKHFTQWTNQLYNRLFRVNGV